MLRVKEAQASLAFYCEVLGFNLVHHKEYPQVEFNAYFVAPVDPASIPSDPKERLTFCMRTPGCIELTWNYGTEKKEGKVYNTGNGDATGTQDGKEVRGGFGHIGITAPDVYNACKRFAELGCDFAKTPNSGGMKVRRRTRGTRLELEPREGWRCHRFVRHWQSLPCWVRCRMAVWLGDRRPSVPFRRPVFGALQ
jgi:lactoylglutathione lyase